MRIEVREYKGLKADFVRFSLERGYMSLEYVKNEILKGADVCKRVYGTSYDMQLVKDTIEGNNTAYICDLYEQVNKDYLDAIEIAKTIGLEV